MRLEQRLGYKHKGIEKRVTNAGIPYPELEVRMTRHAQGDVAARVAVRFAEIYESIRLLRLIVDRLPLGEIVVLLPTPPQGQMGIGWVEGWRGDVFVALVTGPVRTMRDADGCRM